MNEPPRNIVEAFLLVGRRGRLSYWVLLVYLYGLLGDFAWYYLALGVLVIVWVGHDVRKAMATNRHSTRRGFEVIIRPANEEIDKHG